MIAAELIGTYNFLSVKSTVLTDCNTAQFGIYRIYDPGNNIQNKPSGILYGVLLAFSITNFVIQICFHYRNEAHYIRTRTDIGVWIEWKLL